MKIIRKATPKDIKAVVNLGLEALHKNPYPGLIVCPDKVGSIAKEVQAPCNFCYVSETDKVVTGAVSALVHQNMFYERSQASVVQFYCREPGEGIRLLRKFMSWAKARPIIKVICFTMDVKMDPRIGKLLHRLGLNQELPVYMRFK